MVFKVSAISSSCRAADCIPRILHQTWRTHAYNGKSLLLPPSEKGASPRAVQPKNDHMNGF